LQPARQVNLSFGFNHIDGSCSEMLIERAGKAHIQVAAEGWLQAIDK
jgi:hypothetical protein